MNAPPANNHRTPAEWAAYRCQLSCSVGRDALERKTKTPPGITPLEYAVYNLLHAVSELAKIPTETHDTK